MTKILIINGPNLNMLGKRDQNIYGDISLDRIEQNCLDFAKNNNLDVAFEQSNDEGKIVDLIQNSINIFDAIIINAAGYTHTSVAIRDALEIFKGKKIELHISNIYKREDFRHKSLISPVVDNIICGFGADGYIIALSSFNVILGS